MDLIRFDWASKRLLRQKANFVVLEGLLSVVLNDKIKIVRFLESEGNKKHSEDKFNRLDMLAENNRGELCIIEVQNYRELDYFHRMLYGVSKVITEYIHEKSEYADIKKVYSINVLYFGIGQGKDYLYHGYTDFRGVFLKDQLLLTERQQEQFKGIAVGDLYPEYYILRVNEFNKTALTPLDEWFSFLKTGEIPDHATAPGLPEAKERLRRDRMSREEQQEYNAHLENLRYQRSVIQTGIIEGRAEGRAKGRAEGRAEGRVEGRVEGRAEGRAEGKAEGRAEGRAEGKAEGRAEGEAIGLEKGRAELQEEREKMVVNSRRAGVPIETIASITGLTIEQLAEILKKHGLEI